MALDILLDTKLKVTDKNPINGKINGVATAFDDPNEIKIESQTSHSKLYSAIDCIDPGAPVVYDPPFDIVKMIMVEIGQDANDNFLKADITITDTAGDKVITDVERLFIVFGDEFTKVEIEPETASTPVKVLMVGRRS